MRGLPWLALPVALAGCSHVVVLHDPLTAVEHSDLAFVPVHEPGAGALDEAEARAGPRARSGPEGPGAAK